MSGIDIEAIKAQVDAEIGQVVSLGGLEELRVKYLGRKGIIAQLTGSIPSLPQEERALFGQKINSLKEKVNSLIEEKQKSFGNKVVASSNEAFDIGLPGIAQDLGRLHPVTQITEEICAIFTRMGFAIVEGPEVESEYNNFTGLNIPLDHPSRDMFDTFYLDTRKIQNRGSRIQDRLLLRSHTSPVQIRVMKSRKPPLAIIVPGKVYRPDAVDAAHSFMFHQVEGFIVDKNIRFSDLKGALEVFAKGIFGEGIKMRFRPHFFPFTEPSAEVDITCIICGGHKTQDTRPKEKHCSVCGGKGWLEILGSGMIHPQVLKNVGYNPKKYSGFAFGMGVERIAMLKFGIDDIRLFFENDLRFLGQF